MIKKILLVLLLSVSLIGCTSKRDQIYETYSDEDKDIILSLDEKYFDYFTADDKYQKLIESPKFKEENIDAYLTYFDDYSLSTLFYIVNNNIFDTYSKEDVDLFINEKFCIRENLGLYIENKNYGTVDEVLAYVNVKNYAGYYNKDTEVQSDTSLGYLMQANKHYYLGPDYVPDNLVQVPGYDKYLVDVACDAYVEMVAAAKEAGFNIIPVSCYRSYTGQLNLYNRYAAANGVEATDTDTSRAGYSDHQTGYTLDLTVTDVYFENLESDPGYKWLEENAYKYGFIERYPDGKEYITGYVYESWHYRYVGVEAATTIHNTGLTFDEYYEYVVLRGMDVE